MRRLLGILGLVGLASCTPNPRVYVVTCPTFTDTLVASQITWNHDTTTVWSPIDGRIQFRWRGACGVTPIGGTK